VVTQHFIKLRPLITLLLSLWLILQASPALALTELMATVDRNPVVKGEYFVLNITADDDLNSSALDTSGLLKDFMVGRTSIGRSTQIVNFDSRKETRWQILLSPKKLGVVTVPQFTINNVSSPPIILTVAAQGGSKSEENNLYIENQVSTKDAYVGQLITYKVKLYLALELQRGVLSAPSLEGAQIKQLGEDKDGTEIINGRRFRVIERTYAIIADAPGELTIEGATFAGDVLIESQRGNSMFGFNESRPMQAQGEKQVIAIQAVPQSYQGKWFVSDLVLLKETWPDESTALEVGTPITRTVTLIASNTDDTSLPELEFIAPEGLKIYPEKPQRQTFVRDNQIVSQYSITIAIVPSKAGEFTLPEVQVPWWNPHLKQQQTASLPAKIITVGKNQNPTTVPQVQDYSPSASVTPWPWISVIFALLWLVTLLLWRKSHKQAISQQLMASDPSTTREQDAIDTVIASTASPMTSKEKHSGVVLITEIEQALKEKNISLALTLLQAYFSQKMHKSMTLDQISALSPPLGQDLNTLLAKKYSNATQDIDIKTFIDEVKQVLPNEKQDKKPILTSLNP
jgi:hypothetical protein